jgi:2-methylcitrate dehydratase PrpD
VTHVIRTHPNDPPLTAGEATKLAWLTARMAKRGLAGEAVDLSDLQKKFDAIIDKARTRAEQGK